MNHCMYQPASLNALMHDAFLTAVAHGFWEGHDPSDTTVRLAKLALIASEVGEAVEAVRVRGGNFAEELADICIRVFDLACACGVDLEEALLAKMAKNITRPRMHGKLA